MEIPSGYDASQYATERVEITARDGTKVPVSVATNVRVAVHPWLATTVLGLSGFAALVHEIAWTRILALVLGPTTYAFAATLAAVLCVAAKARISTIGFAFGVRMI